MKFCKYKGTFIKGLKQFVPIIRNKMIVGLILNDKGLYYNKQRQ